MDAVNSLPIISEEALLKTVDALTRNIDRGTRLLQELGIRYGVEYKDRPPGERVTISHPRDVVALLGPEMSRLPQEQLRVLLLNTKNNVISQHVIYQGNVNSSMIRPAEVFRAAIVESATYIIVAHNHPSGDPTPSQEDIRITQELADAGKLLGIDLIDHLVISSDSEWVSMKERRLAFSS